MDIAERRLPQDGRFTCELGPDRRKIHIRSACLPTTHGERMTLRLLALETEQLTLNRLGMSKADLKVFAHFTGQKQGLVLLTGPTGSGKSTTLYAALRHRLAHHPGRIITVEDPVEFDVVGYSMGGLVARYAAAPLEGDDGPLTRLRIARLYTISTPHRGARIAKFAVSSSLGKDMLADSDFLRRLDEQWASANYPIVPYVRLGDAIVGASNASPQHLTPRWLPRRPFSRSHNDAYRDPRFIADIAARLRDETPFTTEPVEAVPE